MKLELRDCSLSTSGGKINYFLSEDGKKYAHILDPKTGYPSEGLLSATVITQDAEKADALSTGIIAMGKEKGLDFVKASSEMEVILFPDDDPPGEVFISSSLKGKVLYMEKSRRILRWF